MVLTARDIQKSYGDLHILKGINFSIDKSEIVSITGKSGAGKSTLLHILSTLDVPDSGDINILQRSTASLGKKEVSQLRNEHIGFVFQFHHLINEFTAVENVMLPLLIMGLKRSEAMKKAEKVLEFVGLGERIEHQPQQLSGGEQQRVAIARAIVHEPSIIFADEPTGNLDSENSQSVFDLFDRIRTNYGASFVIVTHDRNFAAKCDRTVEMLDGQIV